MIYTHVLPNGPTGTKSPFDALAQSGQISITTTRSEEPKICAVPKTAITDDHQNESFEMHKSNRSIYSLKWIKEILSLLVGS